MTEGGGLSSIFDQCLVWQFRPGPDRTEVTQELATIQNEMDHVLGLSGPHPHPDLTRFRMRTQEANRAMSNLE